MDFKNFGKLNKNILKKAGVILALFVLLNVVVFTLTISKTIKNAPYPVARAFMVSAATVNQMYIFPLSKLGWENPLTWPFYLVRDSLYNVGMSLYPENEGEKEIWWYNIRFVEFNEVVDREIIQFGIFAKKRSKSQIIKMENWIEEIYSHIQSFPKAKFKDPQYRKEKLSRFADLAMKYLDYSKIIYHEKNKAIYVSDELASNYDNIYRLYLDLKEYSKNHEKESYDYFFRDVTYHDWEILYNIAFEMVRYKVGFNKAGNKILTCDDPYIKVLGENHTKLWNYYKENKDRPDFRAGMRLQLTISTGIEGFTGKMCMDSPYLQGYKQYYEEKAKRLAY